MLRINTLKLSATHRLTIISMLAAISVVIYPIEFPLTFLFPEFLKIDLTDIPAIIGTIFFGPIYGVCIEFIKNVVHFITQGKTAGIGELANFIVGSAYVVPLGLVFGRIKEKKGFIIGALAGTISMIVFACVFNYFILIPFYMKMYDMKIEVYIEAAQKLIRFVDSYPKFIIISIGGFNLVKALVLSFLGYFIYLPLKRYMAQ